jgi:hypothetical protein
MSRPPLNSVVRRRRNDRWTQLKKGEIEMKNKFLAGLATGLFMFVVSGTVNAALITFDDVVIGATSYQYDGDGDGINDVIFSTSDATGFGTAGGGNNTAYINIPGIEGTTLLDVDLRVDFLNGAVDQLSFGFALFDNENEDCWASFDVFDSSDNLLSSNTMYGLYSDMGNGTYSSFPEGLMETSFAGIASYALFDFNTSFIGCDRYIIDDFSGTFGSTEVNPMPEPATMLLFGTGLAGFIGSRIRRKKK